MKYVALCIFALVVFLACGKEPEKPAARPAQPEARASDPADFITAGFLPEQAIKRGALRQQINSLRKAAVVDRKQIQLLVNRRKGEIMSLKKSVRNSTRFTAAQKDSLILPLEEEATELVEDLVAVAQ
jgi:hypothetical protein